MIVLAVVVASTALLFALIGLVAELRSARDGLTSRMRTEVNVTLKSGDEFQGVLFEQDHRILVLRGATQHLPQAVVPVDGELLLRWDDVAYIQKP